MIRSALLPLDAFTSTPDLATFTYVPRSVSAPCNGAERKEAREAEGWDWDVLDDQPGLSAPIMSMMKGSAKERGVRVVR